MSNKEKEFQIRKKEGDELVDYFPNTKASNTRFKDGETLQQKLDNGTLGGSPGDSATLIEHINNKDIHITSSDKNKWNSTLSDAKTYTDKKVADLVNTAPEALDTLKELSDALGNDPNFATTVATEIGKKSDKGHKHTKSEITDFPTSLPASGGNADTLGGYRADDFVKSSGGTMRGTLSVSGANINATNGNFYTNQYVQLEARAGHGAGVASMWYDSTNNEKMLQANNIKDLLLEGNRVYHEGRKPTATEIGARPSNWIPTAAEIGALSTSGGEVSGTLRKFKSNADYDVLHFGESEGDVTASWKLAYKGSTSGTGGNEAILKSTTGTQYEFDHDGNLEYVKNGTRNKFYSQLNKPTVAELGAAAASHGTHVSYGTTTTNLNFGTGGVLGDSARLAREDHTHSLPAMPTLSSLGGLPLSGGTVTGAFKVSKNVSGTGYDDFATSIATTDGSSAGLSLRRDGNTAVAIYHKGSSSKDILRLSRGATTDPASDYSIYHEGNKPTAADIGATPKSGIRQDLTNHALSNADSTTTDIYYLNSSATDKPSGVTDGSLINAQFSSIWKNQIFQDWRNNGRMYLRSKNNGTWGSWDTVYTSRHKPTAADIGAAAASHTHTYLPLAGGSVTGNITMPTDNTGLFLNGGAKVYKKSGAGLRLVPHIDTVGVTITNAADNSDLLNVKSDGITASSYLKVPRTGRVATLGNPGSNIPSSGIASQTAYVEIAAPSNANHNSSTGVVMHHAGTSTSVIEYVNVNNDNGYFNLRSDDANYGVRIASKVEMKYNNSTESFDFVFK